MNKKTIINILKYVIGLGVGVFLFYVATKDIEWKEFWEKRSQINFGWIALAMVVAILSHWFRAVRWKMLLKAAGYESKSANLFATTMVGYLVNQVIPRGGELSRVSLASQTEKFPLSVGFGTLFTDRIFDVIVLGMLVVFAFLAEAGKIKVIFDNAFAQTPEPGAVAETGGIPWKWILLGVFAAGILAAVIFRKKLAEMGIITKIKGFIREMWSAILSVRKLSNPFLFIVYTLGIWVCYILMTYLVFFAWPTTAHIGVYFGLIAFTMGGIGMVFPSPGGVGSYHIAITLTFAAFWQVLGYASYDAAYKVGGEIAFLIHTSQLIMILIVGALCYLYLIPQLRANKDPKKD